MTRQKKLKRRIRARARKTGESYTAARRQVVSARGKGGSPPSIAVTPPRTAPALRAPRASSGISDDAARKKTGHGFEHWFAVLDAFGAPARGHAEAARHLYDAHGVPGWHAQMITVAYERSRGLRATNQRRGGSFDVSVSKVVPASVAAVADAINKAPLRSRWLREVDAALSNALNAAFRGAKPKLLAVKETGYSRLRYKWDETTVEISVTSKPNGKASVVATNEKLAGSTHVEQRRAQWRVALESLKRQLGG